MARGRCWRNRRLRRAPDDRALVSLIRDGHPRRGMPGNRALSEREAAGVAEYVRSLGRVEVVPHDGDPVLGRSLYEEHGCESCHVLRGVGRGFGPELTAVGARRGADHLREKLTTPNSGSRGSFPRSVGDHGRRHHDSRGCASPKMPSMSSSATPITASTHFARASCGASGESLVPA